MHVFSVVGARPQFIKIAPVSRAFEEFSSNRGIPITDTVLHTGQHYDRQMSDVFFEELGIHPPDFQLSVGSGPHGEQTARMLEGIEEKLIELRPDIVVVYGDTNSTLAGALAAAKLQIPLAHVEAGLRSFNRSMPEEVNRLVADHVSELLLAPTKTAMTNLAAENLAERSRLVGDVMLDAVRYYQEASAEPSGVLLKEGLADRDYAILTMHRPVNTDSSVLLDMLNIMNEIADSMISIVFPMHPRTRARVNKEFIEWKPSRNLHVIEPVGYLDMIRLLSKSRVVMTDSGGLQKEAMFAGVRCITLRDETEWEETVTLGCNVLAGASRERILDAVERSLGMSPLAATEAVNEAARAFGDGKAADSIVAEIVELIES